MADSDTRQQALETLTKLIRDMPVAMLTTCIPNHSLNSRPMVNVNSKFDGDLWFFTHGDDPKVKEIQSHPPVNVSFSEPAQHRYVSIGGSAELVHDPKHAELLWTKECQQWFPEGLEDPRLALLKIDVQRAEYWDESTNAMRAIAGLFKSQQAAVKHKKIDWEEARPTPGASE